MDTELRRGREAGPSNCLTAEKKKEKCVLVVSGDRDARTELCRIFGMEYKTCEAEDGRAALGLLASERIALVVSDIEMPLMDGWALLRAVEEDNNLRQTPVVLITDQAECERKAVELGAADVLARPFVEKTILRRTENILARQAADRITGLNRTLAACLKRRESQLKMADFDGLTGILNSQGFYSKVRGHLNAKPNGRFLIIRLDLDNFKVINDLLGTKTGDRVLVDFAKYLGGELQQGSIFGHAGSDHFLIFTADEGNVPQYLMDSATNWAAAYPIDFRLSFCMGVYRIGDPDVEVSNMCDRALLALRSVKNSYFERIGWYDDSLRRQILEEQELVSGMVNGLEKQQFVVYFQPLYDYSSGCALIGAEALVRWKHPEKGLIPPGKFIPLFERNGFISTLDIYVWEKTCALLREWTEKGYQQIPVSVNLSRRDIYRPHLCEEILGLAKKYQVPPAQLRLEITESAYVENPAQLIHVVQTLRGYGFTVEMDDFGSGYSSLNTLKDVPVDILKLDMRFLEAGSSQSRGGSILSSIIRMAQWLELPVIAEGVETRQQADYLKSIGCHIMQGYYFSKPMPSDSFDFVLRDAGQNGVGVRRKPETDIKEIAQFLDASTQSTLLFNSFVGGAIIVEYDGTNVEALRVNDQFFAVSGISPQEFEGKKLRLLETFYPESKKALVKLLEDAVRTGNETQCELHTLPLARGKSGVWFSVRARFLAQNGCRYVFYLTIENITEQKKLMRHNTELTNELTDIMRDVPGGILDFLLTDHIEVLFFNDKAAGMFGFTRAEYAEKFVPDPLSAVHPDDRAGIKEKIDRVLAGQNTELRAKYRRICKDGNWRWVQICGHINRRESGAVYSSAVLLDIDQQVRNEQESLRQGMELKKQRQFLASLYAAIPCGVLLFTRKDQDFRLASINDTAWKIYGYQNAAQFFAVLQGPNKLKDICSADREMVRDELCKVVRSGGQAEFSCRIHRQDGKIRWVQMTIQSSRLGLDLLMIFSDVTEQKRRDILRYSGALFGAFDEVDKLDLEQNTFEILVSRDSRRANGLKYSLKARLGDLCKSLVTPEDVERIHRFFACPMTNDTPRRAEFRCRGKNGTIRYVAMILLHAGGAVYLICSRDVTAEKAAKRLPTSSGKPQGT